MRTGAKLPLADLRGRTPYEVAVLAGLKLSHAQAAALKSVTGEALTAPELKAFRKLTGTRFGKPKPGGYREVIARAGRRSGKTIHLGAAFIVSALLSRCEHLLAPGERGRVLLVGPALAHCTQALDAVSGILEALGVPFGRRTNAIQPGRGLRTVLMATVADHLAPRGGTAIAAVVDEAALLPFDPEADGFDEEVLAAIRPALATTKGKMLLTSSPWMQRGVHYDLVKKWKGKTDADVLALDGPTWLWNPSITEQETRALESDPSRWAREYKAEPGENEESFLRASDIRACIDVGVEERPAVPGIIYRIGFDIGMRRDRTAIVVVHREIRDRPGMPPLDVIVVDCVRTFTPRPGERLPFDVMIESAANISLRYNDAKILRDSFSGDAVHSAFATRGIVSEELTMGSRAQAERFSQLQQLIKGGALRLVDHEQMVRELIDLRMTLHSAGRIEIAAPTRGGAHDDIVDALALAAHSAKSLAPGGSSIEHLISVSVRPGQGVNVRSEYISRTIDGRGVEMISPRLPPRGTAAWRAAKAERNSRGVYAPEDFEEGGEDIAITTPLSGISVPVKF